ncbi:hypothetical protein FACS1894199_05550 [Bacteroidia bacterium]|nr:hypothetical protein FACS1894199_05550 [Bacteroidia bacterium]
MGCGSQQTKESTPVQLMISSKIYTDKINNSTVFSSVRCIPLETNLDVLIDDIVKIIHKENFIYVADRFALYKFNEEGILCGKIKRNGPGPKEYHGIADFEIETDKTVWILSRTDKTLYRYTWDNVLENSIKINYWATKMYFISPDTICVYVGNERDENNQHQLKTINLSTNSVINNHLEIDEKKAKFLHVHSANHFSKDFNRQNELYFFNIFDDEIYKWSNNDIKPAFKMNINNKNIPSSFYEHNYNDVREFFQSLFRGNYAYGTVLFMEYENEYLYAYLYEKERHFSLISKKNNEAILDFKIINEDVMLSGFPINLTEQSYFIQKNNELILPLLPSDIVEYSKSSLNAESQQKVYQHIKYTDENQNPVLLILNR